MNIHIMPVRRFLKLEDVPEGAAAVISTSQELDFSGVTVPYVVAVYMDFDYESSRSFSVQHALRFKEFLENMGLVTDLFVCCDAGESRSPALAAAIYRWLGRSDSFIWENPHYHPNMLVYQIFLETVGIDLSDHEIDYLIHTNQTAFRKAKMG